MRAFYADRLRGTLRESAEAAARAGLTPTGLAALLADERRSRGRSRVFPRRGIVPAPHPGRGAWW